VTPDDGSIDEWTHFSIGGRHRHLKTPEQIALEMAVDYDRLGELMGDQIWSRRALNQMLVEKEWGRPRSLDPGSRKAYAYIKFHEFLAKGFLIESRPYKRIGITELHYQFNKTPNQPESEPRNRFWEGYIARMAEKRRGVFTCPKGQKRKQAAGL
jgi:hypothetical protein